MFYLHLVCLVAVDGEVLVHLFFVWPEDCWFILDVFFSRSGDCHLQF